VKAHDFFYSSRKPKSQGGAILVMVLLIVAVVSTLAINFAGAFQLSVARSENRWHGAQAKAYLLGAEDLALSVLKEDRAEGEVDHLGEIWAQESEPFPVEGGWLSGRVVDAQGLFNLNSLVGSAGDAGSASSAQRFTEEQRRFIRLLQTFESLPLAQGDAVAIVEAIIDWLDSDDRPTGYGGAESNYYNSLDSVYYAGNQNFSSVNELRLVRYITPELYALLEPFVVVLPEKVSININTAPLKLLQTINVSTSLEALSIPDAQELLDSLGSEGFETLAEFENSPAMVGLMPQGASPDMQGLSISSEYFLLYSESLVAKQRRKLESLVLRTEDKLQIIRRIDG